MFTPRNLTLRYSLISATHQILTFITGCAQRLQNMNALLTKKHLMLQKLDFWSKNSNKSFEKESSICYFISSSNVPRSFLTMYQKGHHSNSVGSITVQDYRPIKLCCDYN